jgi:predicted DNA-binding ribbon-helix-helix protein
VANPCRHVGLRNFALHQKFVGGNQGQTIMASSLKRYVTKIRGKSVSITVEPEVMRALRLIARDLDISAPALIDRIRNQKNGSLPCRLRVFVLKHYQELAKGKR